MVRPYHFTCHVAQMHPNQPSLRQGKIIYYQPENTSYDSIPENFQIPSNQTSPGENEKKYKETLKLLVEKMKSNDTIFTKESSSFSNFFHDDFPPEEKFPAQLTTSNKLDTMIHIIEYKDDGANYLILESKSSPTNFDNQYKEIKVEDVVHTKLPTPAKPIQIADNKKPPIPRMDWNEYHRLQTIHNFLDDLEYDYPSICTAGAIGKSLEGRELKIVRISNTDTSNSCVWIDAGIHAREWIAPAVATYIANHIATNFNQLPDSVTNKDWYFLPVVNPDGYEYSHTVDRMWRKNRAWHSGQCVGVDLNRNFSFGWGGKGSSSNPTNAFYRGPEPFSEPESTAMRDMLVNSGLSFKVYITLHSYGQVIIFPFAFKDDLCPDYVTLLEGATVMSKAIYETNGNTYKVGISRDVMYGAAGTSNDFSYGEARIPFCYLIELRSKKHKFKLPKEEIEETGNEILNCVIALMEFVDNSPVKLEK